MRTWRLLSHELAHSLAYGLDALSPGGRDGTLEPTHGSTRSRATLSPLATLALDRRARPGRRVPHRSDRDGHCRDAAGLGLVLESPLVATAPRRTDRTRRRLSRDRSAAPLVRGLLAAKAFRAAASTVSSLALGQCQGHRHRRDSRPARRDDRVRLHARHRVVVAVERRLVLRRLCPPGVDRADLAGPAVLSAGPPGRRHASR